MTLERMNWMQVEEYLRRDDRIMVVTGACEQHGYLSLLADVLEPMAIAERAAAREPVLIAPPLPFGVSPHFTAYPGTISLRLTTFMMVVSEILIALHEQGFRRILVLNGHGGNRIGEVLTEVANARPDIVLDTLNWWQLPEVQAVAARHELIADHANWLENFPFTRVTAVPAETKPRVNPPVGRGAADIRAMLGDGSYGGPYQVSDEIMAEVLGAATQVTVARLRSLPPARTAHR